jgi:hypothetical protein
MTASSSALAEREAARLVGQGLGTGEIARRLGVSAKAVQRWRKLPDFSEAVSQDLDPTIRSTLEAALLANKKDGTPDCGPSVERSTQKIA